MSLLLLIFGFLPLASIGILLFSVSFVDMIIFEARWHFGVVFILVLFFFSLKLHGLAIQFFERHFKSPYHWKQSDTVTVLLMMVSAVITYSLGHTFGLGAFLASAVVGLIGAVFFKRQKTILYTGSFIGMTHTLFLPDFWCILLAALVTGVIYVFSRHSFVGYGGKLGALSLIGTLTSGYILGHQPVSLPIPNMAVGSLIVAFSLFGTFVTLAIRKYVKHDPIFASSLATLFIVGIRQLIPLAIPSILIAAFMMGTFIAMANRLVLPRAVLFFLASFISAFTMIFSQPFLENAGGKLGTLAFIGVITTRGLVDAYHFIVLYLSARRKRFVIDK
ncbi:MAG: hypothetical protein ACQER2_07155 [Bacillota bacterium]